MKGVIFDMDGVLVDSMDFHIESWRRAFLAFNIKVDTELFKINEGRGFEGTIEVVLKKEHKEHALKNKKEIHLTKNKILKEIFELKIYAFLKDILSLLKKRGVKLAVVTGSHKDFAQKIIDTNFKDVFEVIITGDDTIKGKPHPEPYQKALTQLDLNPKDCLVVENALLGIKSAKSAGIKVLALKTTLDTIHLKEADLVLENHKELLDYFKNN